MQLTDLAKRFLVNLGYPKASIVSPVLGGNKQPDRLKAQPDFLIVDIATNSVLGVIAVSGLVSGDGIESIGKRLSDYCKHKPYPLEQYIIALNPTGKTPGEQVVFFGIDANNKEFIQIPIEEFPEYQDLVINCHILKTEGESARSKQNHKDIFLYLYALAFVFILVFMGDIYVDRLLDISYLNIQRSILLVAAAAFIVLPFYYSRR